MFKSRSRCQRQKSNVWSMRGMKNNGDSLYLVLNMEWGLLQKMETTTRSWEWALSMASKVIGPMTTRNWILSVIWMSWEVNLTLDPPDENFREENNMLSLNFGPIWRMRRRERRGRRKRRKEEKGKVKQKQIKALAVYYLVNFKPFSRNIHKLNLKLVW